MKPGRNDPCPCGSGKKYKQCCLKEKQITNEEEFLWHRIRHAIEDLPATLLNHFSTRFGREVFMEAWEEFMLWNDVPFSIETPHITVFMPWFFHDWLPDPAATSVKPEDLDGRTITRVYLDEHGARIDPLCARYLEQCIIAPFSFYDIISVRPNEGFVVRDIITGEEINVTEHSGSHSATVGNILFAKIIKIDKIAMMEGNAQILFPPIEKMAIIHLRNKIKGNLLPITYELLKEYDIEMLEIYHDIMTRLSNPVMPHLQNTD